MDLQAGDGGTCTVNGDGTQTRDFCHVANVVQANL
jgi:nucleoside-diphosphate-sugar epimerase